jgi:hypothetical protein
MELRKMDNVTLDILTEISENNGQLKGKLKVLEMIKEMETFINQSNVEQTYLHGYLSALNELHKYLTT